MRIAIVGSGISGLTAAYLLSQQHDIVVYEAEDRIGGHTATKDIQYENKSYAVDTGFIVFNDWTYPCFKKLLAAIGVAYQPAEMGFSVSCEDTGLEYSGDNLDTLFTQRRNLFSPRYWTMIRDILRFNKQAPIDLDKGGDYLTMTLGEYLERHNYSPMFIDKYLVPMGAAIWSASTSLVKQFPLQFFVKFFINHGLLSVNDRPQWHVIKGGSKSYLEPLTVSFKNSIRLNAKVTAIRRHAAIKHQGSTVTIETASGHEDHFDQVVIASHSDQALSMLEDASATERAVLGAIHYKDNDVVLHTDEALLPNNRKAWSSWNYRIVNDSTNESINDGLIKGESSQQSSQPSPDELPPVLTYNMNILQGLSAPCTFSVTLNKTERINPEKILGRYTYAHPVFTLDAIAAQQKWSSINGVNNTWFCGAYWSNGFHEDGVKSAIRVADKLGVTF